MEINLNIIYHEFYVLCTVYVCVELLIEPAGRVFQNVMSICFFHYHYNRQEEIWPETFLAHVARENNKTQLISISIYSDAEKKEPWTNEILLISYTVFEIEHWMRSKCRNFFISVILEFHWHWLTLLLHMPVIGLIEKILILSYARTFNQRLKSTLSWVISKSQIIKLHIRHFRQKKLCIWQWNERGELFL